MRIWKLAFFAVVLTVSGCGGEARYPVSGVVTLDGEALPGANVSFVAESREGETIVARTDENGCYELNRSETELGARPGKYKVFISTYQEGNLDADEPIPSVAEKAPAKYNLQSTLTAEVRMDRENEFDFVLDSN